MSEVKTLFVCVVCEKGWPSKQSLRAHMKVHKKEGYIRTSIIAQKERWAAFQEVCKKHKTTACHLLGALIDACVKGEKEGLVNIGSSNPVVIQVNHFFSGVPRSPFKGLRNPDLAPDPLTRVVRCNALVHKNWNVGRLGWCKNVDRWVTPEVCLGCRIEPRARAVL